MSNVGVLLSGLWLLKGTSSSLSYFVETGSLMESGTCFFFFFLDLLVGEALGFTCLCPTTSSTGDRLGGCITHAWVLSRL